MLDAAYLFDRVDDGPILSAGVPDDRLDEVGPIQLELNSLL